MFSGAKSAVMWQVRGASWSADGLMVKERRVWTNPQGCEEPRRVLICERQGLKYTLEVLSVEKDHR